MASFKDTAIARPSSSHRLSVSSGTSGNSASRLANPRPHAHSHSLSVGSLNSAHRVTRRKSTSSTAVNNAIAAALREAGTPIESGSGLIKRPSSAAKNAGLKHASHPSLPSSLPSQAAFGQSTYRDTPHNDAVTDGPPLSSLPEKEKSSSKPRVRRASEGSRLIKGESKRGSAPELKCEKCGKGYKHSSCLTKHLWEHTPEWAITSKLLISKHQQVQLLEAASVLVAMNHDGPAGESDQSSPAASGSSDPREDAVSSTDTTPPPDMNAPYQASRPELGDKRLSSSSSAYSQSYQSVFSDSTSGGRPYVSHYRQWSTDGRPTTSGTSVTGSYRDDEDQADLAAAVGLLSCSFGTPKSGPVMLPADVPPVPPLPAKYSKPDILSGSTTTLTPHYHSATGRNFSSSGSQDVEMDGADEDTDHYHRMRNYEEEEGVFGKMEE